MSGRRYPSRLWFGNGFNLDEAYEFLDGLGLLSSTKGEGGKTASLNASTLNALLQSGRTKRGTRTSTTYCAARAKTVSLSVLGNAHPSKIIALDRQLQGNHTAACKERFLVCLDNAEPRHAPLPAAIPGTPREAWTWLPLTAHQAAVFSWESFLNAPEVAARELATQDDGLPHAVQ